MPGSHRSSLVQISLARSIVGIAGSSLQREGTERWLPVRPRTTQDRCLRILPRRVSGGSRHLIALAVEKENGVLKRSWFHDQDNNFTCLDIMRKVSCDDAQRNITSFRVNIGSRTTQIHNTSQRNLGKLRKVGDVLHNCVRKLEFLKRTHNQHNGTQSTNK